MQIEITKPGLQTTIQDQGRIGWMHMGFSQCGAMDPLAAYMANLLVERPAMAPILEFTMIGPDIHFDSDFQIAITGADCLFELNSKPVPMYTTISIKAGDRLTFNAMKSGCRGYIAFRQSMSLPEYLGSLSTHLSAKVGGHNGQMLKAGDKIEFEPTHAINSNQINKSKRPQYIGNYQVRICKAPETDLFSAKDQTEFSKQTFQVSQEINRMGLRLDNVFETTTERPEMLSRGLTPGAIQVPPNGQPILAGPDAQTTGGYSRIAQIIRTDLPILAQLRPNDNLSFHWLTIEQAKRLYSAQKMQLSDLL